MYSSWKPKYSRWIFTLNNYTPTHVATLRQKFYSYICFGYEMSKSRTPHLQGYIEFSQDITLLEVKKLFKTRKVWLKPCTETPFLARRYCLKDGSYEEYGLFENCSIDSRKELLPFVRAYEID